MRKMQRANRQQPRMIVRGAPMRSRSGETPQHYVYTLADGEGRVFYVGRGTGNGILAHEREARAGKLSRTCAAIRAIWAHGEHVIGTKVAHYASEDEAAWHARQLQASFVNLIDDVEVNAQSVEATLSPQDRHSFGASIRHIDAAGSEYWSAREVAQFLGHATWPPFHTILRRVERLLQLMGADLAEDMRPPISPVVIGRDAERDIKDIHLSRTAFLLVVQNADSAKPIVAHGKSYIARQVLRADVPSGIIHTLGPANRPRQIQIREDA
jgi:LEM-3-like GIY-YIG domain